MMSETTENGTLAGRIGLLPGKAAGQEEMPPQVDCTVYGRNRGCYF